LGNRILRDPHARAQHALENQASDMGRDVFPTRRANELLLATSVRPAPGRSGGTRSRRWHTYILCESAHQQADLNVLASSVPQPSTACPHGPGVRVNEMNNIYNPSNGAWGRCVVHEADGVRNRWDISNEHGDGELAPGVPMNRTSP
jgi:hypothetical protein